MAVPLGLCNICGGDNLHPGDDGFFYCAACGSQSQQFQEQAVDVLDAQFVGAIKRSGRPQQPGTEVFPSQHASQRLFDSQDGLLSQPLSQFMSTQSIYGGEGGAFSQLRSQLGVKEEIPWNLGSCVEGGLQDPSQIGKVKEVLASSIRQCYVEGLQKILQLQCEVAVQKFGVSSLICGIVGPIWLRFLACSRVYEKEWAGEAIEVEEARKDERSSKKTRNQAQKDDNMLTGDNIQATTKTSRVKASVWEPRTCHGTKARLVWLAALKERIPLAVTLALLFLACHIAREPVLPTDVVKWCLEGTLPYLTAFCDITKHRSEHSMSLPVDATMMFRPTNPISAKKLEFMAASIANRVGLQLPPVNFHAISCRFLRQLQLPLEKLSVYMCRVFDWYAPSGLWLSDQKGALPTRVYVMAMVVIVLKVMYKIHGHGYWEKSVASSRESDKRLNPLSCSNKADKCEQRITSVSTTPAAEMVSEEKEKFIGRALKEEHSREASAKRLPQDMCSFREQHHGCHKLTSEKEGTQNEASHCKDFENVENNIWDGQKMLEDLDRCRREDKSQHFDYEQDLPTYLKYCRDVVFSVPRISTEEQNLCDHLWRLYEKLHKEDSELKITKEVLHSIEMEPAKRHMPSVSGVQGDSHLSFADLKGGESNATQYSAGRSSKPHNFSGRNIKPESGAPNVNAWEKKKSISEIENSRLLTRDRPMSQQLVEIIYDMKESGFSYVPPRRKPAPPDGYIRYTRPDAKGSVSHELVHADYFILLCACAKMINVEPKALHRCIQRIENGLKLIERNVKTVIESEVKSMDGYEGI